jgi:UDP-N-acetylglucosamine 1-carboxyvinyltransferase
MSAIVVTGGRPLTGEVRVGGAKNSALKLMAASLLAPGASSLSNVPDIADVAVMQELLEGLGARVVRSDHALIIDATELSSHEAPYEMVARMRASTSVLGPLVARLGRARVALPGGCNIGSRKIDMHITGLRALGANVDVRHGYIVAEAPDGLRGARVSLDFPSVGATENLLMAASLATGETIVENAAREPEIVDLARFLSEMGANIEGAGSSAVTITGVASLAPARHAVVGDRIEAGTYLAAGALDRGPVTVRGFDPEHLDIVLADLAAAGVTVERLADGATVSRSGPLLPVDVATLPYPGFPTDMQAQFMTLLALAEGDSVITENVFENRFMFADEVARMGADVRIDGHHALIRGVRSLSGAEVRCPDLRGGAALVLAGLVADGVTTVTDIGHIERGYEGFVDKLAGLGADIRIDPSVHVAEG